MTDLELALDHDPAAYEAIHAVLDEPSADLLLTERERRIRDQSRNLAARQLAPRAALTDSEHTFPQPQMRSLCEAGLGGLLFPEELGGSGDSTVAYALAMEEIAAACAATSLVFMTQMHCAYPILLAGSESVQRAYIPPLLDGSRYGALGITEPEAGSDVASLTTTARPAPDGWRLSGQKTFITTGDRADVLIGFATVDPGLGRRGITAFVVDGEAPGMTRGRPFRKLGMHGSSTAEVFFDDVPVPRANLLGAEGEGWAIVMQAVVKSRISAAAQGVGLARAAYARTLAVLNTLHQGRLSDEATFSLAGLRGQILQGRLLLHAVARQIDSGSETSPADVGIMKQSCTDLGWRASVEATRILGPWGDFASLGVERCLRDAKVTQIYDGTNEIQRLLIGRETTRAVNALAPDAGRSPASTRQETQ